VVPKAKQESSIFKKGTRDKRLVVLFAGDHLQLVVVTC